MKQKPEPPGIRVLLVIHPDMLKLFDEYCKNRYMNRTEGIKHAIRELVIKK